MSYSYSDRPTSPGLGSVKVLTDASPITLSRTYLSLIFARGKGPNSSRGPLVRQVGHRRNACVASCTRGVNFKDGGCDLIVVG